MTNALIYLAFGLLVLHHGTTRSLPEEEDSVVSVYTTQPNMASVKIDVYHQIANNIAEKITSPIYSFFGYGKNKTEKATTKWPWDTIEILDEPESKTNSIPIDNDISKDKDVEELSTEAIKKVDQKPEKITLYSNYLPSENIEKLDGNDTINNISDDDDTLNFDDLDDFADSKSKEGPLIRLLEIFGSIVQLLYGGISALFASNKETQ